MGAGKQAWASRRRPIKTGGNLLQLAPEMQEAILFLPLTTKGRDPIREHHIRPIAAELDWRKQRRLWKGLAFDRQAEPVDDDAHSQTTYPDRIQPVARGGTSAAPLS